MLALSRRERVVHAAFCTGCVLLGTGGMAWLHSAMYDGHHMSRPLVGAWLVTLSLDAWWIRDYWLNSRFVRAQLDAAWAWVASGGVLVLDKWSESFVYGRRPDSPEAKATRLVQELAFLEQLEREHQKTTEQNAAARRAEFRVIITEGTCLPGREDDEEPAGVLVAVGGAGES